MGFKLAAWTALAALSIGQVQLDQHNHRLCEGFVEENNMYIAISERQSGGIDEATFNQVLDRIEELYRPIISDLGGTLDVKRNWADGTVNAYAQRIGSTYQIQMFGGLARHFAITADGFALVACHEIGHHLGGAPKYSGFSRWASNEGQADYFAGLKCLRLYYTPETNLAWYEANAGSIPATAVQQCQANFGDEQEYLSCLRTAMAGMSVGILFQDLRKEKNAPDFSTPDTNKVTKTQDSHPATQCRLDTYFQGGLCVKSVKDTLSDTDYKQGTCTEDQGFNSGLRPLCWFKPL